MRALAGWHPAVWWLERQLRIEREVACDEIAVARHRHRQALRGVPDRDGQLLPGRQHLASAVGVFSSPTLRTAHPAHPVDGTLATANGPRHASSFAGAVAIGVFAAWPSRVCVSSARPRSRRSAVQPITVAAGRPDAVRPRDRFRRPILASAIRGAGRTAERRNEPRRAPRRRCARLQLAPSHARITQSTAAAPYRAIRAA